jgi:hypothetical protein
MSPPGALTTAACMGLPEPDGGVPFVLMACRDESGVLVLGTTGRDGDVESLVTDPVHAREILNTAQHHHKLLSLPFHVGLHLIERSFAAEPHPGWAALLEVLDEGSLNAARLLDPTRGLSTELDPKVRIESILDQESGIAFGIDEAIVESVFEDLIGVVNSPLVQAEEGRKKRLARIINQAADLALDERCRHRWTEALRSTACLLRDQDMDAMSQACWHTALALQQDRRGSEIPFVRVWVERQLALTVQTAMSMMGPGSLAQRIAKTQGDLES